jgi:phenylalanine-4-hydroxylase
LSRPGIPQLDELNERLFARTGWTVVSVPGLVPDDIFFDHLAKRRFPAGNFIRSAAQLDYLEEPDVFHDVFGHVPLLAQPAIADFMQAIGEAGLQALELGALHRLARLYWYTVEFGPHPRAWRAAHLRRRHPVQLRRKPVRAGKPGAAPPCL